MASIEKKRRQQGVTLVEMLIGLTIAMIVGAVMWQTLRSQQNLVDRFLSKSDGVNTIAAFRASLRRDFLFRTQIDHTLGAGIYSGVIFDRLVSPNAFNVRMRNRDVLDQIGRTEYKTWCAPRSQRPAPRPPADFCSDIPVCADNQALTITMSTWADESNTSDPPNRQINFPPSSVKGRQRLTGAAFCVIEADNDKIRLKISVEHKTHANEYGWRTENLEIWEDLGRQGIEFLR